MQNQQPIQKIRVLFVSDCFGANGSEPDSSGKVSYHRKGTIAEFTSEKDSAKTFADLRAGGRIVPPTKENLLRCKAELEKSIRKQQAAALEEKRPVTNPITIPKDLTDELASLAKADKK